MPSKTWSRKPIAALVAVAILSVYSMVVLASPAAKVPSGELSTNGQVTVNGENALSGGTVFSDSVLSTADASNATVNLSKLGRVELLARSNLKLSFTDRDVSGLLQTGSANISTVAGVGVTITTADGTVKTDGSQPTSFTVKVVKGVTSLTTHSGVAQLRVGNSFKNVAAGETATTGMPQGDDDDTLSGGALAVLLLAIGGAVAGVLYAAFHNNDLNFGGTVVVISPSK